MDYEKGSDGGMEWWSDESKNTLLSMFHYDRVFHYEAWVMRANCSSLSAGRRNRWIWGEGQPVLKGFCFSPATMAAAASAER
jgi:hypothetical protein